MGGGAGSGRVSGQRQRPRGLCEHVVRERRKALGFERGPVVDPGVQAPGVVEALEVLEELLLGEAGAQEAAPELRLDRLDQALRYGVDRSTQRHVANLSKGQAATLSG